jgi:FtsZ-binding cell division protein ZapB
LSVGSSVSIISANDISTRTENVRSNCLLSSNATSRLSLPNVDHIQQLKREVDKLKKELNHTQESHRQKMEQLVREEQDIRNENLRLQRKLQLEVRFSNSFFSSFKSKSFL